MSIVQMIHKGSGDLVWVDDEEFDAEWYEPAEAPEEAPEDTEPVREEPPSADNGQGDDPDEEPAEPEEIESPPDGGKPLAAILAGNVGAVAEYVASEDSIPHLEDLLNLEFADEPDEWEAGGFEQRVGQKRKGVRKLVEERVKELSDG